MLLLIAAVAAPSKVIYMQVEKTEGHCSAEQR